MNLKKRIYFLLFLVLVIISNTYIIKKIEIIKRNQEFKLSYILTSKKADSFQVFYSDVDNEWKENNSKVVEYDRIYRPEVLEFYFSKENKNLRIDLGNFSNTLEIKSMVIEINGNKRKIELTTPNFIEVKNNIKKINDTTIIETDGSDPYIILSSEKLNLSNLMSLKEAKTFPYLMLKIFLCLFLDLLLYFIIMKSEIIFDFAKELIKNRMLIFNLAKNDFKTKYAGSYLGIIWAFIQPIITMMLYWFVFEFGLRAGASSKGAPFILWLMSGLIPWFFFSDGINNATNCMQEYSYLVKKVVFKIDILPVVKIISTLFVHLVFIGFLFIVAFCYKFYPSYYTLQIFYYLGCMSIMILSISYITAAIILFFKDLGQIINILLQIGMWMTPIMWNYEMLPKKYQWMVKLNPIAYITEGYRDVFINKIWFWDKKIQTIYFWGICLILFFIGMIIFKKLKPHFADVL